MRFYSVWVAGAIIAIFIVFQGLLGWDLAWNVGSFEVQFFTSMLAHGSTVHLLGNLFGILLFGLLLEAVIGSKRFVHILIVSAIVGNLAGIGSYERVLGISGGVYGLIGALSVLRPTLVIWLSGLPVPMILVGIGYALYDIIGLSAGVTQTGHLAHLGGLVVGVFFGLRHRKDVLIPPKKRVKKSVNDPSLDRALDSYEQRFMRR